MVKLKRVYDDAARGDGHRVLVERLWPRGIRKQDLAIDERLKDVAPSTALRKWFGHDPERWSEFKRRYHRELMQSPAHERLLELAHRAAKETVTLIFSSHDTEHNNTVVLKAELDERVQRMAARAEHHPTGA
jgi:uncharacterized protein YeaO (DUF488 family)